MLTPTGWWIAEQAIDLRCGIDRLLLHVQSALGRDAFDGGAYVFRNRSATRIKVLCCDANGVWLCVRRLHRGSFVWPRRGDAVCTMTREQFDWLCSGIDWQRMSATTAMLQRAL